MNQSFELWLLYNVQTLNFKLIKICKNFLKFFYSSKPLNTKNLIDTIFIFVEI